MRSPDFSAVNKMKKQIEKELLLDENVVSIGTVKEKSVDGNETGNFVIQVGLITVANPEIVSNIKLRIKHYCQ